MGKNKIDFEAYATVVAIKLLATKEEETLVITDKIKLLRGGGDVTLSEADIECLMAMCVVSKNVLDTVKKAGGKMR